MCGRFLLTADILEIAEAFEVEDVACLGRPGGEVFPGQQVLAAVRDGRSRLVEFKWGLIPSWARDPSIGARLINARAETITQKPAFKKPFAEQRCLVVASGFYEWKREGRKKTRFLFSPKSESLLAMAGLYDTWRSPEGRIEKTCTIITTAANELIAPVHDRMPVIVAPRDRARWLDAAVSDPKDLLALLKPYPSDGINMSTQ